MALCLARVDNRLVHGQVLEAWVPFLGADTVLVVDRRLAGDPLQKRLIEGLSLADLDVRVVQPPEATRLLAADLLRRNVLVLFSDVGAAAEAQEEGVAFERLNLGNVHPKQGSRPVTASVYLTEEEVSVLKRIVARGVVVEARAVPKDRSPDLSALLGSCRG